MRARRAGGRSSDLPALAFDHEKIVQLALTRLRYKIEYSAAGFRLLPECFTLSELQRAYEIILGEPLDKRNFRRRIIEAEVIEPADGFRSGEGRPARLYRFRRDAVAEVKARPPVSLEVHSGKFCRIVTLRAARFQVQSRKFYGIVIPACFRACVPQPPSRRESSCPVSASRPWSSWMPDYALSPTPPNTRA